MTPKAYRAVRQVARLIGEGEASVYEVLIDGCIGGIAEIEAYYELKGKKTPTDVVKVKRVMMQTYKRLRKLYFGV
jgi:hypothetical protein